MLGVGAIIGTGIFVLTGQAAAANAGPAIVISMVIAGLTSVLAALCYSEFAASVPVAGSAYTYAYATLGEFIAWIIGWDLILEYALGAATVAVGWSGNLVTLLHQLGMQFPAAVERRARDGRPARRGGMATTVAVFNLPAVIITIAVTALLIVGVSESATVNAVIVVIKVGDRAGRHRRRRDVHPDRPTGIRSSRRTPGTFGEYGWSGVLRGAGVIFFAYIGFDAVSTSAQEARDPQRDMPRGILGSLAICTDALRARLGGDGRRRPVQADAQRAGAAGHRRARRRRARAAGTPWGPFMNALTVLLTVGALAALSSVMVVMMLAQPRIFLAMSQDGLLPAWAGAIHPRFNTPHISTIVTGVVVAIAAGLTPIATLGMLVSIGTLMAFVIVSIGVIVLRRTRPDLPRPFRMPLVPLLPGAVGHGRVRVDAGPAAGDMGAADRLDGASASSSTSSTATAAAG